MELRVVRDLITFAKNPNLPIPMYDLNENFNPFISLNVTVKNSAETSASKAILKAYTPDRKRVLYTIERAVGLNPGEEVDIPVQFTLPGLGGTEYGKKLGYYPIPVTLEKYGHSTDNYSELLIARENNVIQKRERRSCTKQQRGLKFRTKSEVV